MVISSQVMVKKQDSKIELASLPQAVQDHIEQLERVRRDFVANVSHELRTPLTVLQGYLETLLKKDGEMPLAWRQKVFPQMYQHSVRMETIINDLLLLSRLENEDELEQSEAIDGYHILLAMLDDAKNISGEKQHQFHLNADQSLLLKGSESQLKSLFSNFIINAVKYTPKQGRIDIDWYQQAGQAVFRVTDTGIGIAEKHIPRLTERFYRVDKARSRENGGTGLGLAIAKHVLMRHQGELDIKSEVAKGSVFTCVFPSHRVVIRDKQLA